MLKLRDRFIDRCSDGGMENGHFMLRLNMSSLMTRDNFNEKLPFDDKRGWKLECLWVMVERSMTLLLATQLRQQPDSFGFHGKNSASH